MAVALEAMSFRRTQLETLPEDGMNLEELISDLKNEYGTPATPQEYRLLIKVPAAQDAAEGAAAVEAVRLDPPDEEATVDGEQTRPRRRRRGRRRRRSGSVEAGESTTEESAPSDGPGEIEGTI